MSRLNSPFFFKLRYYEPSSKNQAKNMAHIQYIGTRSGVDMGEPNLEEELGAMEHLEYMTERPRSHGLFGSDEEANLKDAKKELADHEGYTWRAIISLREDDAIRLGYIERSSWEKMLKASMNEVAGKMGIRETNLKWYGAFHQEQGHPHCHIIFWEKEPERLRWTREQMGTEIKDMRKEFIRHLYADERQRLGQERTVLRDLLMDKTKEAVDEAVLTELKVRSLVGNRPGIPPKMRASDDLTIDQLGYLQTKLQDLAEGMPKKGRIALAFMPPEVKNETREIADWLMKQPEMSDAVKRIEEIAREYSAPYSFQKRYHDQAAENAKKDIRKSLSQIVLRGATKIEPLNKDKDIAGTLAPSILGDEHGIEYNGDSQHNFERTAFELEEKSDEIPQSLWQDIWKATDRAVYKNNAEIERKTPVAVSDEFKNEMMEQLKGIAAQFSYFDFQGKPLLAYLPGEIQTTTRDLALYILKEKSLLQYHNNLSEMEKEQLHNRAANMVVEYASQLNLIDFPEFEFKKHSSRADEAMEQLSKASIEFIKHDDEETRWTVKAFHEVCTALNVEENEKAVMLQNFAGRLYDSKTIDSIINDKKLKVWLTKDKDGVQRLSTKNWNRLRNNLGLEEEQLLRPWFAVVKNDESPKALIKPVLMEERVAEAIEALKNATEKPSNNQELGWTLNTMNNTLKVLGVSDEERKAVLKSWVETAQVKISEARLRDILDRTDVAPIKDFSVGKENWQRLLLNLGVKKISEVPWKFQKKDIKALGIFNDTWRELGRAIYKETGNKDMQELKTSSETISAIGSQLEKIAEEVKELGHARIIDVDALPLELQREITSIKDVVLEDEGYLTRLQAFKNMVNVDSNEKIEDLAKQINSKIIATVNSMLPRDEIQVDMVIHEDRAKALIEQIKTANVDYINDDAKEIAWTARSLFRTLTKIGAEEDIVLAAIHSFGDQVGLKEGKIQVLLEREKEYLIKQVAHLEGKDKEIISYISKYEFKRLIENLDLDEEQALYPWFGMGKEQEAGFKNIRFEIALDSKEKIANAVKEAMGTPNSAEELKWTVHVLNSVLHSVGVSNAERKELINDWINRTGIDKSQINLHDILDRIDLMTPEKNRFFIGQENWRRLTRNLGIKNLDNPYKFEVKSQINMANSVWKSAWRALERELSKAEAQRELAQRKDAWKNKLKHEQEEKR